MNLKLYSSVDQITKNDIQEIKDFDIEKISDLFYDPFTFNIGIINDPRIGILGAGIIRVVNEFKMVLNPNLTDFKRAKLIKLLLNEAKKKSQCNEIIVEITQGGSHYENILINHFDFQPTYGNVLRLET